MKKGFTLIELAIVVVVLGILITGIVGGRSLIASSERQKFMKDQEMYKNAFLAFKLEFDGIPGDFDEATDYWGGRVSHKLCNGNDNKKIGDGSAQWCTNSPFPDDAIRREREGVWQHLSFSKIINNGFYEKDFSVSKDFTHMETIRGGNVVIRYNWELFERNANNRKPGHAYEVSSPIFSTKEAYQIDKKFDDGHAMRGIITMKTGGGQAYCNVGSVGSWSLSSEGKCGIFVKWPWLD